MSEPCLICGKLTEKLHFQVNICYGCAAFYRRSANSHKKYKCRNGKMKCNLKGSTNGLCRLCRYNRCLQLDLKINKFCQKTNNFYEIMNYEPDKTNPWNMYDMFYQINDIFKKSIPSTSSSTPNFFNFFNETIFSMIAASLPKQKWIPFSIEKEATFKTASFINNFAINSAKLLSSFQNFQKLPNNEKLILHDRFWQMFIYLRNVYVVFEHYGYESEFKVLIDNFQYLDEKSAPKFLEVDLENEGSKTFVVPYEEKLDKFYVEFKKVKATSFEFTYICLIALWSFHCLPQISESTKEIADKIIENASIKLHEYYTKELRMPDYAGRQAKLYKIAIMIEVS
uniref:Nuclear receptor domain-containing protein n=1 Tax=Panagrolaimus sp. PS1159 TaxID=55785 RepID=A0AC35FBT7_9BILA